MHNQAHPTCRNILKISLGLGGVFHTLCVPALAEAKGEEWLSRSPSKHTQTTLLGKKVNHKPSYTDGLSTDGESRRSTSAPPENAPSIALTEVSAPLSPQFSLTTEPCKGRGVSAIAHTRLGSQGQWVSKIGNEENSSEKISNEKISSDVRCLFPSQPHDMETAQELTQPIKQADLELPVLAGSLSDEHLEADLEGTSVFTLDEQTQTADSQPSLSFKETQETLIDLSDSDVLPYERLKDNDDEQSEASEDNANDSDGERSQTNESAEEWLQALPAFVSEQQVIVEDGEKLDDELGTLRLLQLRSRNNEELGILRLLQTAEATPPPPQPPIAFLTGRLGYFSTENAFRSEPRLDEEIYQSGLTFYVFPKLSNSTSLYGIAETNLARYENFDSVNYNELELQLGVRQKLAGRTFAQIGWRNQRLYEPGYRERLFNVHYVDSLISHRSILNAKTWLDSFYQMRLGFADPEAASRLRQTFTFSLNYGATRDLRTSLIYQLDFDDYTQVSRFDTYQQILGIVSYNLTPESRITVFGGTRFGRSSIPQVNLNDTFYGAGLNVSVPLF